MGRRELFINSIRLLYFVRVTYRYLGHTDGGLVTGCGVEMVESPPFS